MIVAFICSVYDDQMFKHLKKSKIERHKSVIFININLGRTYKNGQSETSWYVSWIKLYRKVYKHMSYPIYINKNYSYKKEGV